MGRVKGCIPVFPRNWSIKKVISVFCLLLVGCSWVIETGAGTPSGNEAPTPGGIVVTQTDDPSTPSVATTGTNDPNAGRLQVANYGVVYPYPDKAWDETDRLDIRERLAYIRSLGVDTVIQVFPGRMIALGTQQNWLIFLDEAMQAGIQVVAYLYPSNEENNKRFKYQEVDEFLLTVKDHPAFLAYLGLHEPLEQLGSRDLQTFYRHVKQVAPNVRVAHYLDDMAWYDANLRFPGRRFEAGICDICIIWYYPALTENGQPVFDIDHLRQMAAANRALVDERSPGSALWFLGQAYSFQNEKLRMPTPDEMEIIFDTAIQAKVDGFLWYPWQHDLYDRVLEDPEMAPQRELIRTIYDSFHAGSP